MLITFAPAEDPHKRPASYHVAIKAGLHHKAVQVCLITPNITTYPPSIFRFVPESQFELRRTYTRHGCAPSPSDGLFTLGAKCDRCKNANHLLPRLRIEPVTLRPKVQHYRGAIKAGLYRKAVQVCFITPNTTTLWPVFHLCKKAVWMIAKPMWQ